MVCILRRDFCSWPLARRFEGAPYFLPPAVGLHFHGPRAPSWLWSRSSSRWRWRGVAGSGLHQRTSAVAGYSVEPRQCCWQRGRSARSAASASRPRRRTRATTCSPRYLAKTGAVSSGTVRFRCHPRASGCWATSGLRQRYQNNRHPRQRSWLQPPCPQADGRIQLRGCGLRRRLPD